MGGFYNPQCAYVASELGGLSVKRFCEAVSAEANGAFKIWDGANFCLHTHDFFKTFDYMHIGKPSRIAFADRDVREDDRYLARSEEFCCFSVPWFKKLDKEWIERYAHAFRKVIENHTQLLEADQQQAQGGRWYGTENT